MKKPVFIPSDSEFVFEISEGHVFKVHSKLFSFENKKAVITGKTTEQLEKELQQLAKVMNTSIYKLLF